jgi:hypothetical protein
MQRDLVQGGNTTAALNGQLEFLWMIVTFVLTIVGFGEEAPAKAPADRNIAAKAAESVRVLKDFVILLSRCWDHALNLRAD